MKGEAEHNFATQKERGGCVCPCCAYQRMTVSANDKCHLS